MRFPPGNSPVNTTMTHRYSLATLVPEAAAQHADAVAAACDDLQLTWEQLDRRTGQLAAALTASGVAPGDRVGIYVHKSLESLVAIHGILRAGAAYVPIDPMAPTDSIATIVGDCGIATLVTHELRRPGVARLIDVLAAAGRSDLRTVIGLDEPVEVAGPESVLSMSWDEVAGLDPTAPVHRLGDDLAYVMYTSGSTGTPKGISHTHRSGLSYATMSAEIYGLGPDDRVANFSPLHFDMSTFEVLAGVAAASRVVLIPEQYLRLPASLAQYIAEQGCTTLYTVPSLFQQLLTRGNLADHDLSAVRWVLPAGEVFPPEPLKQLIATVPHARFSNVYGPAEVNQCTYYHFDEAPADDQPLPIGYACDDAELAIGDEDDRAVVGTEQGRLLVRAATMMAGYWERPDLDDNGILYLTGNDGQQQRWYRTGDIVSRQPDPAVTETGRGSATVAADATAAEPVSVGGMGAAMVERDQCLLYHGRSDNQIKIRGNRIELETVEAAVGSLLGVEQAVVGVRLNDGGDSQLIVRYVAAGDAGLDGWRQTLAARLPMYALPAAFEEVDRFPLTPSGKIDRRTVRTDIATSDAIAER
jgi:amino acid adenylation domain-containing protein